ncbi:MAG: L-histidine N(alpha)-methyltransferase [Chitinophagaceae bacterium]|nr:L-histidine N(alpha)-methyltransferase [Oligoflexus sp.]
MKIENLIEAKSKTEIIDSFAIDILTGLSCSPKHIAAKYFYDDRGSELFQKITLERDYYLTGKEFSILENISNTMPELLKESEIDVVELGVGDGHKSKLLIDGLLHHGSKVNYFPIDISERALELLAENINPQDRLAIQGVAADYFAGLSHVRTLSHNRQLVLFLGSNIGNFDHPQTLEFLQRLWKSLNEGDYVLIGFDLKKDIDVLVKAYNDEGGYTKQFNLNLLSRINRELGGQFEIDRFKHYGFYNPLMGAMESYLVSLQKQDVYVSAIERSFHFEEYEAVHLEYSFKFLQNDIDRLASETGFQVIKHFTDEEHYFIDSLWKVIKN